MHVRTEGDKSVASSAKFETFTKSNCTFGFIIGIYSYTKLVDFFTDLGWKQ